METYTQAFHAGVIVSKIENYLPKESIPPLGICMANFHALRELFGERLWQKMKGRIRFRESILVYEALTYQAFLPREIIGSSRDFCLGYSMSYRNSKRKKKRDLTLAKHLDEIDAHVTRVLGS